jgi:hypothetical protein
MAIEFDGLSQYVEVADATSLRLSGVCFMSAWVYVDEFPPSSGEVLDSIIVKKYADSKIGYYLDIHNNSGTVRLRAGSYGPTDNFTTWNISGWNTGEWHWVAGGYDGANWNLWFDGTRVAQTSDETGAIETSQPLNLGCTNLAGTYSRFLGGKLFDCRVYNRYPSDNEIAEIYFKRGADRVCQGLVGRWRLDELPSGTLPPLLLDSMDATSGWSTNGCTISSNSTAYIEGSASLNIRKTTTTSQSAYIYKTISSANLTGQTIKVSVYVKDAATLAKINRIILWFGQDASNRYYYAYSGELSTGWNLISAHVDDFSVFTGSPTKTGVKILYLTAEAKNKTDTWADNDVLFDFCRAGDYPYSGVFQAVDLSGNGNHGIPQGGTYQDSPHRLRRGVLIS